MARRPGLRLGSALALAATALAVSQPALADHGFPHAVGNGRGQSSPSPSFAQTQTTSLAQGQSAAGVVQSVSSRAVLLRELDGAIVSVQVDRSTQVTLDGRPGSLEQVRPGDVVVVTGAPHSGWLLRVATSGQ
jgi:hypothetical protein